MPATPDRPRMFPGNLLYRKEVKIPLANGTSISIKGVVADNCIMLNADGSKKGYGEMVWLANEKNFPDLEPETASICEGLAEWVRVYSGRAINMDNIAESPPCNRRGVWVERGAIIDE